MESKELTTQQRIEILEDVLQKLESGDTDGGLCVKIEDSAFKLFRVCDEEKNIIPLFTFENAKKITEVMERANEFGYWWNFELFYSKIKIRDYDFKNRIKFVKWMINEELKNNI